MAKKTGLVDMGTGDVFRDLGFADADERKLRTQLAMRLNDLIKERKLTQKAAAGIFGVPQPHHAVGLGSVLVASAGLAQ